ncbi:MAG: sulfur carrier protein ThiS [Desulfocapsaceae bacterium]|nr:sulfur carrier protein ThiS [Desulfocapsaceae bacterium]
MRIFINGDEVEIKEGACLEDVILFLKLTKHGLAIAVNTTVVPRENWQNHQLTDNDAVMFIRAAQGG